MKQKSGTVELHPLLYQSIHFYVPELWKSYVDMVNGGSTPEQVVEEWQDKYTEYMTETGQTGFEG